MLRLADRMGRGRGRMRWLDRVNPPAPALRQPDLAGWENHALAAAAIGHASILLRIGGMTILTDPVLSNRIGVGLGLMTGGPKRHVAPALSLRQLPKIDLILISHAHFDHLDRPTLVRMDKKIPIITAPNTSDLISDLGFRHVTELRWGESLDVGRDATRITAQEVRHWGARSFYDHHRGFSGYVIQSPDGRRRVLYGGDSAYQDKFKDVGKVDLAILGIAAYDPYIQAHATPEQAWAMADHVRADHVLPMHHSTFRLSHEPMAEPLERMLSVAGRGVDRLVAYEVGCTWTNGAS